MVRVVMVFSSPDSCVEHGRLIDEVFKMNKFAMVIISAQEKSDDEIKAEIATEFYSHPTSLLLIERILCKKIGIAGDDVLFLDKNLSGREVASKVNYLQSH